MTVAEPQRPRAAIDVPSAEMHLYVFSKFTQMVTLVIQGRSAPSRAAEDALLNGSLDDLATEICATVGAKQLVRCAAVMACDLLVEATGERDARWEATLEVASTVHDKWTVSLAEALDAHESTGPDADVLPIRRAVS